jgi:molecular chaperone GrpE
MSSDSTQRPGNPADDEQPKSGRPEGDTAAATVSGQDELAQAQRQRDDYFDQLQRTRAEFANYQKRSKAQADTDRVYAVGSLARDLLDAMDNLERAADALRATNIPGVAEGLDMVQKQMLATLAKHGVEPIVALGKAFDPNEHEALVQQPDATNPEGTVVAELSKGYRIRDRVLRPSKVAVSIKPPKS